MGGELLESQTVKLASGCTDVPLYLPEASGKVNRDRSFKNSEGVCWFALGSSSSDAPLIGRPGTAKDVLGGLAE